MPIYGQQCKKCGHQFDDFRNMSEADKQPRCPECGGVSQRDYGGDGGTSHKPGYFKPILSDALAVHPTQIADAKKKFPHHEFHPDGRMVLRSHQERKRVLKDLGFHDRDGY